jgi:acyl-coenzyme A thioesterase PaaI-like protein
MAKAVFERFRKASVKMNSFNRVFYENLEVEEENNFLLKVTSEMCQDRIIHPACVVALADGVTSIAFLAKTGFEGFSVSVRLKTEILEDCFEGDLVKIRTFLEFYEPFMKIGRVRGEVFREDELVSLVSHTVCYTGKTSN